MGNTYSDALKFWDAAFELNDEDKEQVIKEIDADISWKGLASSEKLRDVMLEHLLGCKKVLDYGCGEGWAGITLSKAGCNDVTCVDVVENAIKFANFLSIAYGVTSNYKAKYVSTDWISKEEENSYDGIFCSNVIDVLPADVAEDIIRNISRIATKDAKIIISMNYYLEPVSRPDKNIEVKNGNEIYLNGILRVVSRTDEEWAEILSDYFEVEKIEYFAWPGETVEKRRIFILKNASF